MVTIAMAACTPELPPYGEVVLEVDTNVSPRLAQRLQIDVFSEDGRWLTTRTLLQDFASDWPVSFSVVAPFDEADTEALVRLRLYPTGRRRIYRGIRYDDVPFEPAFVPTNLEQACTDPPTIGVGEARWQRRGITPFMSSVSIGTCAQLPLSKVGSTVAKVEVTTPGDYVFEVRDIDPPIGEDQGTQISLQLRSNCFAESSTLMCDLGIVDLEDEFQIALPRIEARNLAPGTYYLVTTGAQNAPADILLSAQAADATEDVTIIGEEPTVEIPDEPFRLTDGSIPDFEPLPSVTVDRLVRVALQDGTRGGTKVTLRGDCFGSAAQLSAQPNAQRVVLDEAVSCVDAANLDGPVTTEPGAPLIPAVTPTIAGTFPFIESCEGVTLPNDRVCVPGGAFLLGASAVVVSVGDAAPMPERVAVIDRFAIDRREVTVGQWRAAGIIPPDLFGLQETVGNFASGGPQSYCTYTSVSANPPREDHPMMCLSWWNARAYCQARGGDLPTAAQWEYVASAAGRETETLFPWGNDYPVCSANDCAPEDPCHAAVFSRQPPEAAGIANQCAAPGATQPTSVLAYEDPVHGDATVPLHGGPNAIVYGLAGGVREYTRDAFHSYDSPCWTSAPLRNPICFEELAVQREGRGSGWFTTSASTVSAARGGSSGVWTFADLQHGFRCVYPIEESTL